MATEAGLDELEGRDFVPYVRAAVEAFGPERCMYGSDWPVCELACSHTSRRMTRSSRRWGRSAQAEHAAIFGGTAARFYGLKESENG